MRKYIKILSKRKYEAYLLSLLILLFGQIFLPRGFEAIWQHLLVIQNVLIGLFLFKDSRRWIYTLVVILSIVLVSECFLLFWMDTPPLRFSMGTIFSIYFFLASFKIYKGVLLAKEVSHETIAAVFSGFIMLGFIGGFLFTLIEIANDGSFTNLGTGEVKYQNLNYFSFVSLLTIGYGDIVPLTQVAKKTAMFLGLLGNFYLTFVTAVIIGKFMIQKR